MEILDHITIERKIKRLAYQIFEENYHADQLVLLGINKSGKKFAQLIYSELQLATDFKIMMGEIHLAPSNPLSSDISCTISADDLKNKNIIIFDDVANTGRTLFYACKPILDALPNKLEIAVLVDRKHKSFPIQVNYVGLSLATTLSDHILVNFDGPVMNAELN
jgi:pyrimidine operon attenuation protein/uracil phosphoribosyltransferase